MFTLRGALACHAGGLAVVRHPTQPIQEYWGGCPKECHAHSVHTVQSFVYGLPSIIHGDNDIQFTSPTSWYRSTLKAMGTQAQFGTPYSTTNGDVHACIQVPGWQCFNVYPIGFLASLCYTKVASWFSLQCARSAHTVQKHGPGRHSWSSGS